jgi:hypothetical protein
MSQRIVIAGSEIPDQPTYEMLVPEGESLVTSNCGCSLHCMVLQVQNRAENTKLKDISHGMRSLLLSFIGRARLPGQRNERLLWKGHLMAEAEENERLLCEGCLHFFNDTKNPILCRCF